MGKGYLWSTVLSGLESKSTHVTSPGQTPLTFAPRGEREIRIYGVHGLFSRSLVSKGDAGEWSAD